MIRNIYHEENNKAPNEFITGLLQNNIIPHDQRNPVYKYMSIETAKIVLSNCSVRFSSPTLFNDPFEMNVGFLDFEVDSAFFKRILSENHTAQECDAILKTFSTDDLRKAYEKTFMHQQKQALVFCTSRSNANTLMWSHYADNHKGVCLGLIMPTIYADPEMVTMNVNYVTSIEPLKVLGSNDTERTYNMYRWINTKSAVWEYEQEVRSFISNMNNQIPSGDKFYYDINLDPQQIVEIYFGVGTSRADEAMITDIIKQRRYDVEKSGKMEISKSTFDLKLRHY